MSRGDGPTWTAREIVLDLFPATDERLVPRPLRYRVLGAEDGTVAILDRFGRCVARLAPLTPAGNPTAHLCCDLCRRVSTRRFVGHFRLALPDSNGRRFRYLCACRDHAACDTHRLDDDGIDALLTPGS